MRVKMSFCCALVLLVASCDRRPPADMSGAVLVPAARVTEPAPVAEASRVVGTSERPWRWYRQAPDRDTGGLGDGALHGRATQHYVDDPRRYVVTREEGTLVVTRENRTELDPPVAPMWTQRYAVDATGDPVIGVDIGGMVVAAAPTARGYVLVSIDGDDGSVSWQKAHDRGGPGPVQLTLQPPDAIVAYVLGDAGAFLHELDPSDGALVAERRFGAEVHRAFTPPAERARRIGTRGADGYRLVREGREGLALTSEDWRARLSSEDPFSDHVALVELDDLVVAITFCSGASGADAHGIDRLTGARRWETSPGSIGSIGHSMYGNDVRAVRDGDLVLVYGDESGGRYVGVIDTLTGRLIGYEVWRM